MIDNKAEYICKTEGLPISEFISFAKEEYGLTVHAVESPTPDTFERLFGKGDKENE